jgi:hypothetical protein
LGGPLQGRGTGTRRPGEVEARGTEDGGEGSGCGEKIGAWSRARPGWAGQDGTGGQGPGNKRSRWRDVNRDRSGCRGGCGMAGGWEARWRVKEWTKKFNPAVEDPTVAVPKPKPKGNEGVKVGRDDEHLGRVRVGEEPVPFLHGHVEGLDVREFRWETTRETGE